MLRKTEEKKHRLSSIKINEIVEEELTFEIFEVRLDRFDSFIGHSKKHKQCYEHFDLERHFLDVHLVDVFII